MAGQGQGPAAGNPSPGLDAILSALRQGPQPQGNAPQGMPPLMQGAGTQAAFINSLRGQNPELAQALSTPMGRQLAPSQNVAQLGTGQFGGNF